MGERAEGPSDGEKTKTFFEGKEYDYVWSVAIEDGEPALKLPYNVAGKHRPILTSRVTENPQRTPPQPPSASWSETTSRCRT
jgi:hypothetical protein